MQEDGSWQFDYRACELEVSFQLGGGGEGLFPPKKKIVVAATADDESVVLR